MIQRGKGWGWDWGRTEKLSKLSDDNNSQHYNKQRKDEPRKKSL